MTTISSKSMDAGGAARIEPVLANTQKIIRENEISPEKIARTTLEISAEGKVLFEQSLVPVTANANVEKTQQHGIRIEGTEDKETALWKFQNMSAEDKEFYVQQRLAEFDGTLARRDKYYADHPTAVRPLADLSRERAEASARLTVELMSAPLSIKVTGERVYSRVVTETPNGAVPSAPSASDLAVASGAVVATAGAPPSENSIFKENHAMYLPNVSHLTLDLARKSIGIAELFIKNKDDEKTSVHSRYGDQVISDMQSYLAAVKDHIGKLEMGLLASHEGGKEASA